MANKSVSERIKDSIFIFNFLKKDERIERIVECLRELCDKKNFELKSPGVDKNIIEVSNINIFDNMGNHLRVSISTLEQKDLLKELEDKFISTCSNLNLNISSNITKGYNNYCLEIKITLNDLPEEVLSKLKKYQISISYNMTEVISTICKILDKVPVLGANEIEKIMKAKDKNWNLPIHIYSTSIPNKEKDGTNKLSSIMYYGNLKNYTNTFDRIELIGKIHSKCYNIPILPTLSEDSKIAILIRYLETSLPSHTSFSMKI